MTTTHIPATAPHEPAAPPARTQRHITYTEWTVPAGGPSAPLQAAIDAAQSDSARGDRLVWHRVDSSPNGPVIVVGYTTEITQ